MKKKKTCSPYILTFRLIAVEDFLVVFSLHLSTIGFPALVVTSVIQLYLVKANELVL